MIGTYANSSIGLLNDISITKSWEVKFNDTITSNERKSSNQYRFLIETGFMLIQKSSIYNGNFSFK